MSENLHVADGLFTLDREALSAMLAGQDCMRTLPIVWQKAREWWDDDAATKALNDAKAQYRGRSETDLRLILWLRCTDYLDLTPRIYENRDDWAAAVDELVVNAVRMRRTQVSDFVGTSLRDLTEDVLRQLFESLADQIDEASEDEQSRLLQSVSDYLDSLPAEQQERVRAALGADDLSAEVVRKALTTGTLWTALAGTVSVMGFGAYSGAVVLLHGLASLVGITLPFAAYTGLTSLIAVVTSPFFIVPLLAGGGWWLTARSDKRIREGMAPLLVVQLALAGMDADPDERRDANAHELVEVFQDRLTNQVALLHECEEAEAEQGADQVSAQTAQAQVRSLQQQIGALDAKAQEKANEITEGLMARPLELANHRLVPQIATEMVALCELRREESARSAATHQRSNWWEGVIGAAGDAWVSLKQWDKKTDLGHKLATMGPSELESLPLDGWFAAEVKQLIPTARSREELRSQLKAAEAEKETYSGRQRIAEQRASRARERAAANERIYPRLSDHARVSMGRQTT